MASATRFRSFILLSVVSLGGLWPVPTAAQLPAELLERLPPEHRHHFRQPGPAPLEVPPTVGHCGWLSHRNYSTDGQLLLTTAPDQSILWNVVTGEALQRFPGSNVEPLISDDNSLLAIAGTLYRSSTPGSPDSYLPVVARSDTTTLLKQHAFSPDGQEVGFLSLGHLEIYRIANGELLRQISHSELSASLRNSFGTRQFGAMRLIGEGHFIAMIHNGGDFYIVRMREHTVFRRIDGDIYGDSHLSPTGRWTYSSHWHDTGEQQHYIRVYDNLTGELVLDTVGRERFHWTNFEHTDSPLFIEGDTQCIVGLTTNQPFKYDLINRRTLVTYEGIPSVLGHNPNNVLEMLLLDDNKVIECRAARHTCRWDVQTGELLQHFEVPPTYSGHVSHSYTLKVIPNRAGDLLLVGHQLWRTEFGDTDSPPQPEDPNVFRVNAQDTPPWMEFTPQGNGILGRMPPLDHLATVQLYDFHRRKLLAEIASLPITRVSAGFNEDATILRTGNNHVLLADQALLPRPSIYDRPTWLPRIQLPNHLSELLVLHHATPVPMWPRRPAFVSAPAGNSPLRILYPGDHSAEVWNTAEGCRRQVIYFLDGGRTFVFSDAPIAESLTPRKLN